ncbi:hypothetical protein [Streptomyces sp. I05A-00742]|uniref:hypothetical protein n=1 Tax=Streptomyces sp. I05A-00742 TaxID=2732853 RepID=UPI001488593B|nr:hypothetical protein [Streptomyces sp. I05A-00742]
MGKLTYADVTGVGLSSLNRAVSDWKEITTQLSEVAKDARDGMLREADRARWAGVNSDVTREVIRKTAKEFEDAHAEATSIRNCLEQAHTDLLAVRASILDAVEAAKRTVVVVDNRDGTVRCEFAICAAGDEQPGQAEQNGKQRLEDFINELLSQARDIDDGVAQALGKSHGNESHNFGHAKYESLDDVREEQKDRRVSLDIDDAPKQFGGGTLKPAAEFFSYRSWMNSFETGMHGEFGKSWEYFLGGTPSYSGGLVSKGLEKNIGGGGRHRKPSAVNRLGRVGTKIFGAPVALVATGIDFFYTPPGGNEKKEGSRVVAPREPGRVEYKP